MQTSKTLETLSRMHGLTVQCSQVPCPENVSAPRSHLLLQNCVHDSTQWHFLKQDSSVQVQAASLQ